MAGAAIEVRGGDHEHVLALSAAGPDAPFDYRVTGAAALAATVLGGDAFDACEFSLANHIMLHVAGARRTPAIPVFPSRAFRNTALYVAADDPIARPRDLAGRRIAVSEYAMTPAIWARGHLLDEDGLDWREVEWIVGPDQRFPAPTGARTRAAAGDLEAMVAAGEADALLAGRPRDLARPAAERRLRCLFPDPAARERGWFERTGVFPILHTVVLHERFAGDAATPRRLFDAYVAARRSALARRLGAGFAPFAERDWEALADPLADPTRYGLTPANRAAIALLTRHLAEQGFIDREPEVDALFVAGAAAWADE